MWPSGHTKAADRVSVNMADNGNDDLRRRLEAQEQTFKTQQEALDNIQQMLAQLLNNRNNNDTESNHDEEEHLSNDGEYETFVLTLINGRQSLNYNEVSAALVKL